MDISIIIPNYNGAKLLARNVPKVLASIASYHNGNIELLIADDASEDNSKEIITALFAKIGKNISCLLVENDNKGKRGFSKNVNRAVRMAQGEIIILLNSDVLPHKDFYTSLLSHFTNPQVFAVGCMDESKEGESVVLRGRGIGKWEKGFLMHRKGSVEKTDTLWVSGGSGAFRKSLWEKLGGLYDIYDPFYWEDIDLSYRAQKAGYHIIFEPKSKVIHEHEAGVIKSKFSKSTIQTISYRNQFLFVWINATDSKIILEHIFRIPLFLASTIKDRNKEALIGFCQALLLLPQAFLLRMKNNQFLKKTDHELEIES